MKILYVTTIGSTMGFFKPLIKKLIDEGHTVDIATNEDGSSVPECYRQWGCTVYPISTSRSPVSMGNLKAIGQIRNLVNKNGYEIVHCHTPLAAAATRMACIGARKRGVRVFYTAHGFHFYKGAPLKNWVIFYTIEKICARFTDVLITINKEDYQTACAKLPAKQVEYIPGVGIHVEKFSENTANKAEKRRELGIADDAFVLLSVGELNANKNHSTVMKAIAQLPDKNIHYVIAGAGELAKPLADLAVQLGLAERVHLLGRRNDVPELCRAADVYVHPSFREGLSVAVMEAMASGLPCAVSRIRGNSDMIDEQGGILFDPHSIEACRDGIASLLSADLQKLGEKNAAEAKRFSCDCLDEQMKSLYMG